MGNNHGGLCQRRHEIPHTGLECIKPFATGGGCVEFDMGALGRDALGQVLEDIGAQMAFPIASKDLLEAVIHVIITPA